jgi:uncharacterized protein (TIRG00374 family)
VDKLSLKRWLKKAFGPLVLIAILASLDFERLFDVLKNADVTYLLLAYGVVVPPVLARVVRFRLLLSPHHQASFATLAVVYFYAIFLGTLTPGRVGELIKVAHLSSRGVKKGTALAVTLTDRLFDVAVLLAFGAAAVVGVAAADADATQLSGVAAVLLLVGFPAGARLLAHPKTGGFLAALVGRFSPKLRMLVEEFQDGLATLTIPRLFWALLLSAIAWSGNFAGNYFLARALGFDMGYIDVASVAAASNLVALLPITVMGAGTRDATLIVLLKPYGVDVAGAVALSVLFLSLVFWLGVVSAWSLLHPASKVAPSSGDERRSVSAEKRAAPPKN